MGSDKEEEEEDVAKGEGQVQIYQQSYYKARG